jgi:hypothetical protein
MDAMLEDTLFLTTNIMSNNKKGLVQLLLHLQTNELGITKDGNNPHFKSKYMTLDEIHDKLNPVLTEYGVYIYHKGAADGVETFATDGDTTISSFLPFESGLNAQKIGAATTYYRRYNICLLFNILADADDDGNKASSKAAPKAEVSQVKMSFSAVMKGLGQKHGWKTKKEGYDWVKEQTGVEIDAQSTDHVLEKVLSKLQ